MERTFEGYAWLLARRLERMGRARPRAVARRLLARHAVRPTGTRLDNLESAWGRLDACLRRRGLPRVAGEPPRRLLCDESLAGLARWLWAAGCEAERGGRPGAVLVPRALETGAALLTSDARVLERRAVTRGGLRALWLPVQREPPEQLGLAFEELGLRRGEPRCMRCGGPLDRVEKAAVAARIPPRTARWLDDYQVCRDCDGLFWRGTHWQRIAARLPG